MTIFDLMPTGCTVETDGGLAAIHDRDGTLVAILCGAPHNAELARLIVALPVMMRAIEVSLEHGMLLPVARGVSALDAAVFPPLMRPAA
jgi:hypothetical protein